MDKDTIVFEGQILECHPDSRFTVKINEKLTVNAYLGGKLKKHFVKLFPGERVLVELSPYDLKNGRIIKRISSNSDKSD
ncbi:MAG: translation initiation factor IF-1 [Deltaproteobacteria bacterium]|nr:translation initiation factor IF-1 [Deltaproteobacteria bacterium]MCX7953302.1 translation initiation factor IF-1 [Deltaproteobacteria bacterium]